MRGAFSDPTHLAPHGLDPPPAQILRNGARAPGMLALHVTLGLLVEGAATVTVWDDIVPRGTWAPWRPSGSTIFTINRAAWCVLTQTTCACPAKVDG